jgi:signal transduction histidine kinase
VPLLFRGVALGALVAIDRAPGGSWGPEHEGLLQSFAASAATAVHTAQSVAADLMRRSIVAAEEERRRWARELHDETLQGLAALRMLLSAALQRESPEEIAGAVTEAVGYIETEAENLRSMIAELRPAALDTLGLGPALESLVERTRSIQDLDVELDLDIADRLEPELESTVYRLVQEALTNAAKHAGAAHVSATVHSRDGSVEVTVRDDGAGFDPSLRVRGFGLAGMRERVALAHGDLQITSAPGDGTTIHATFPHAPAPARVAS